MRKPRLQRLWEEAVPQKGPSPQPRPRAVLRRVREGMATAPAQASIRRRKLLRRVLVLAVLAALLLFGGALAANQGELGEHNVLQVFFCRGETGEGMEALVNTQPVSVSDENYTLTLTSSIADQNDVYFTLTIQAKTEHAREALAAGMVGANSTNGTGILEEYVSEGWRCKPSWRCKSAGGDYENYDPETGTQQVAISMGMGFGLRKEMAVRYDGMEEGLWLHFPVKPLSPIKRSINAQGQGCGSKEYAPGNPVYLKKVVLTPLSVRMKYNTEEHAPGTPVLDYLWKDGHVSSFGELHVVFPSGTGGKTCDYSWQFKSIQDISQMEAVIFEGMAYPLDGGRPYPYTGELATRPFALSARENQSHVGNTYPFFALCDSLGAACSWDPEAGTATATYRGVTLSFTLGSKELHVKSATTDQVTEMEHPPLLEDGELWVDCLDYEWHIQIRPAFQDLWGSLEKEDGRGGFDCFLVYP